MKQVVQNILKERSLIIIVFLVSLFFRFYQITKMPISLNWDEAAFGYNAFSILETGRDEYGTRLPLEFKSVGDYKCPLFVYLTVPVIKLFGLNEFGIRFLSSLFGAMSVVILFLIVKELFGRTLVAFLSSILLAISPWHLQFTRAQGDVSVSSLFVVLGVYLFLKWIKNGGYYLYFSVLSFVITFYSYFGERFFTPVLYLFLCIFFRREIIDKKTQFIKSILLGILLFLPLLATLLSSGQKSKILMTTIFGHKRPVEYLEKTKKEDRGSLIFNIFHNAGVEYGTMIVARYLNHFSPDFLFINGPPDDRQRIEGMGMLYWSDIVLLIFLVTGFKKSVFKKKSLIFVLIWLAISPLPSIITRDPVHARRAFNMIYPISILSGIGLMNFIDYVRNSKKLFYKYILISGFSLIFVWSLGFYLLSYYIYSPLKTFKGPGGWQYGYKQLVEFVSPIKNKYDRIVVDTTYQGPYLFFLFYEKYPPLLYQKQAVLIKKNENDLGEGKGYDKYIFREIYWPVDRGIKKSLFAGPPERIPLNDIDPKQARILKTIYFPDSTIAFYVVETF